MILSKSNLNPLPVKWDCNKQWWRTGEPKRWRQAPEFNVILQSPPGGGRSHHHPLYRRLNSTESPRGSRGDNHRGGFEPWSLGSRALAAFLGNEVQCFHTLTRSTWLGRCHPHFMNEGTEAQGNPPQALWGSSPGRVAGLGRILPHYRCSNGTNLVFPGRRWGLESSWPQLGGSGGGAHL